MSTAIELNVASIESGGGRRGFGLENEDNGDRGMEMAMAMAMAMVERWDGSSGAQGEMSNAKPTAEFGGHVSARCQK